MTLYSIQTHLDEHVVRYCEENALTVRNDSMARFLDMPIGPKRYGHACQYDLPRTFPEDRIADLKITMADNATDFIRECLDASTNNTLAYHITQDCSYDNTNQRITMFLLGYFMMPEDTL